MSANNTENLEQSIKMPVNNTGILEQMFDKFLEQSMKVERCNKFIDTVMWTAGRFPTKQSDTKESKDRTQAYLMLKYDECISEARQ